MLPVCFGCQTLVIMMENISQESIMPVLYLLTTNTLHLPDHLTQEWKNNYRKNLANL